VKLAGGGLDRRNTLLEQLDRESTPSLVNGGAYRWAIAATADHTLELQLQTIPLPAARLLASPQLLEDSAAAHIACTWPLKSPRFDGEVHLRGPVPILFTDQPEELRSLLAARPDPFLPYLNRAMKRLVNELLKFSMRKPGAGLKVFLVIKQVKKTSLET
jgi:hypothetical protein